MGFELRKENGETWAAMEVPTEEQMKLIKKAVALLEGQQVQEPHKRDNSPSGSFAVEFIGLCHRQKHAVLHQGFKTIPTERLLEHWY